MDAKLNAILQKHVVGDDLDAKNKLLGASFIVVSEQGVIASSSAGRNDLTPTARPFDGQSVSFVASMTKLITITCIMQLVERGTLPLDGDVRAAVPELGAMQILRGFDDDGKPVLEDNTKPITLRMLLTHTVGLGYDIPDPDLIRWSEHVGRTARNLDWSREGFSTPLKFAPGDGWCYGTAIDWAGLLLEAATGQTLGAYMARNILEPLGMARTTFHPGTAFDDDGTAVASTYRQPDGTLRPGPAPVDGRVRHPVESGGAGLFTTAGDYATFLHAFLAGSLLRPDTIDDVFRPQLTPAQRAMLEQVVYSPEAHDGFAPEFPRGLALDHGLGGLLNVDDVPGKRAGGSMTWSGMCNARWWIDRKNGVGAVLFTHIQPFGDPVVKTLYDELERVVYEHL